MRNLLRTPGWASVGLALCLLLGGCSGSKDRKFKVGGKLTRGGQPLKPKDTGPVPPGAGDQRVQVIFYKVEEGKPRGATPAGIDPRYAKVNVEDGTFEVPGGLAPGKYVVAVHVRSRGPQGPDELKDKYSYKNSTISVDIDGNKTDLDIDLDRYK